MSDNKKIMIGKTLKALMDYDNLEIEDLVKVGFSKTNIQKYLNDYRRPTIEDLVRLANEFHTSVDFLLGNTKHKLDPFDHDFLKEFIEYASNKINTHFEVRQNTEIPDKEPVQWVLTGLITYLLVSTNGKIYEDLENVEVEYKKAVTENLIAIFDECINMASQNKQDLQEFETILQKIKESNNGEYSFKDSYVLNDLEKREDLSGEEKIKMIKSYISINVANGQKAINMLTELSNKQ